MSRGRKPLPDNIKKMRGTDQKCRMRGEGLSVPKIKDLKRITSTRGIRLLKSERSKRIFISKCNQLIAIGILTETDLDQISIYSDALDKYYTCISELQQKGMFSPRYDVNGNVIGFISNPYLKLYQDLAILINKIGSDFGFSPVQRQKIKIEKPKELNPIEELTKLINK